MNILKYDQYNMVERLFYLIENPPIMESNLNSGIEQILKGLSRDIKFNIGLVFTFGVGIKAMYPIVENLVRNSNLKIEITTENIVLISLAAISITYLEEKNNKAGDGFVQCKCKSKNNDCKYCGGKGVLKSTVTKEDAKTILEELKLRGIGNGIIKKIVESFKSIGNIVKSIFKNSQYSIAGLIDMLGYTALLIPIMNAISALIGEYNLNMDTLPGNFLSLGFSVGTFLAKRGFNFIINRIKDKVKLSKSVTSYDTSKESEDIVDGNVNELEIGKNKLIKEQ